MTLVQDELQLFRAEPAAPWPRLDADPGRCVAWLAIRKRRGLVAHDATSRTLSRRALEGNARDGARVKRLDERGRLPKTLTGTIRRIELREAEREKKRALAGDSFPSVQRPGYIVHGLHVRSDFPLPLAHAGNGMQPHVEVVRRGPAPVPVPDEPPPGESYGAVGTPPARSWWSLDGDTWRIRFPARCELRVAPPWGRVEVDVHVGAPADVVADRIVKIGVLFALERQGRHVLHASAVHIQDATIAFAGTSGSGKSTLAALLCADGGALVSDDQLRVDFAGGEVTCHPGLDALRLRTEVRELAKLLGGGSDSTWDGRTAVLPASVEGPQRLDVLVLPALTTEHDTLRVEALSRPEAMVALAGTRAIPRIPEWLAARFHTHASLVQRLPAFRVLLPFGSVPGADARRALLERVLASG